MIVDRKVEGNALYVSKMLGFENSYWFSHDILIHRSNGSSNTCSSKFQEGLWVIIMFEREWGNLT